MALFSSGCLSRQGSQISNCKEKMTRTGFAPDNFKYKVIHLPLAGRERRQCKSNPKVQDGGFPSLHVPGYIHLIQIYTLI